LGTRAIGGQADNVRAKHSKEEFSKDLSNEQKNASPLPGEGGKVKDMKIDRPVALKEYIK